MTIHSETCHAPRPRRCGWRYIRVRRFVRAKSNTLPAGDGSHCSETPPGVIPAYRSRSMIFRSIRYMVTELVHLRNPDPRCFVTPSYTGGPSRASVNGRLRRPQCFGTHGEPWAQPFGLRQSINTSAPVVEQAIPGGWVLHLEEGFA